MADLILGILRPSGAAGVLEKAAAMLGVPVPPYPDEARILRVAYAICTADGKGKCDCGALTLGGGCCDDMRPLAVAAIAAYEAP